VRPVSVIAKTRKGEGGGLARNRVEQPQETINPSGRAMALGSTQPLTEMSTSGISWGGIKAAVLRADNLATFMCALRACSNLYRDFFTFTFSFI